MKCIMLQGTPWSVCNAAVYHTRWCIMDYKRTLIPQEWYNTKWTRVAYPLGNQQWCNESVFTQYTCQTVVDAPHWYCMQTQIINNSIMNVSCVSFIYYGSVQSKSPSLHLFVSMWHQVPVCFFFPANTCTSTFSLHKQSPDCKSQLQEEELSDDKSCLGQVYD